VRQPGVRKEELDALLLGVKDEILKEVSAHGVYVPERRRGCSETRVEFGVQGGSTYWSMMRKLRPVTP
jgi:hypothetical protein